MAQRVIDLSLAIEDNTPAHKLFQRPVIITHMSHDSTKSFDLGVPGDRDRCGANSDRAVPDTFATLMLNTGTTAASGQNTRSVS